VSDIKWPLCRPSSAKSRLCAVRKRLGPVLPKEAAKLLTAHQVVIWHTQIRRFIWRRTA